MVAAKTTAAPGRPFDGWLPRPMLIDRVLQANGSARVAWLDQFSDQELLEYVRHLEASTGPRERGEGWIRDYDTPAACEHIPQHV